jgi:hypothetical protein
VNGHFQDTLQVTPLYRQHSIIVSKDDNIRPQTSAGSQLLMVVTVVAHKSPQGSKKKHSTCTNPRTSLSEVEPFHVTILSAAAARDYPLLLRRR